MWIDEVVAIFKNLVYNFILYVRMIKDELSSAN